jgi:hypothetical protein
VKKKTKHFGPVFLSQAKVGIIAEGQQNIKEIVIYYDVKNNILLAFCRRQRVMHSGIFTELCRIMAILNVSLKSGI